MAGSNPAPLVMSELAERIKEIGRENNVPIIENKALARGLYRHCPLGAEVPGIFFQAVAIVLAQVYRLAGKKEYLSTPTTP